MNYRAEIDGLRALAVIPVMLFHAGFTQFSGGFIGVDIFFVISGYLITTILIEDIETKKMDLLDFYERRARRILPALFFVMLACIPMAWTWMLPDQMKEFSHSLIAVSLFFSNIFFLNQSGYFDSASEEKPLLHTWSLALEEQYYILFPIILMVVWRWGRSTTFWTLLLIATTSLLVSESTSHRAINANFYLLPTRAWELLAGSIAALIIRSKGIQQSNFISLIGLFAIIVSLLTFDKATRTPSAHTLIPVLGTNLIILYGGHNPLVAKLLSLKVCVGV